MIGASSEPMLTFTSAGSVMRTATIDETMTAFAGTWFLLSFAQREAPGTAPSRLNANSIRDVLVMQAVEQKNWPTAAMNSTAKAHFASSAWAKMTATPPPPAVSSSGFWTAKRNASSRIQPPMAE